ncbi:hypothetical protein PINS_up020609 [Pythium insidiosum]|nr:hypothetical protein PINS_up020609 [Pythium insidiosum]
MTKTLHNFDDLNSTTQWRLVIAVAWLPKLTRGRSVPFSIHHFFIRANRLQANATGLVQMTPNASSHSSACSLFRQHSAPVVPLLVLGALSQYSASTLHTM